MHKENRVYTSSFFNPFHDNVHFKHNLTALQYKKHLIIKKKKINKHKLKAV